MARVHHAAIGTRDVEASLSFWRDGLGFEVLMDHSFDGPWPELFGSAGTSLRSVFLGDPSEPESGIVELVELEGMAPPVDGRARSGGGFFLLSLYADLDAVLPRLAGLGVGGEPVVAPVGPGPPGRRARSQRGAGRAHGLGGAGQHGVADRGGEVSEPVGHWRVAIVGAGPGGLGLAIALAESGRRDFVLLEAADGVGGTWRLNTYPGAACDVPSHLYSYSFALKPDWTKTYATQPEILRYFEDCADRFGIGPHLRTGVRVEAARWDEARHRWVVTDDAGRVYEADVVVSAIGTFAAPRPPDIEGLASFAGPVLPLGALGARARPDGPAGGGDRHRGQCCADRARAGEGLRAGRRVPAHAPVDPAPQGRRLQRRGQGALRPRPRGHGHAPRGDLLGLRELHCLPDGQ